MSSRYESGCQSATAAARPPPGFKPSTREVAGMDVPGIVQSELDGEDVAASVSLGGEDGLYVTPTRTLVYRSESLLSDETVEEYPHDAERVTVNEGRRKARITLTYSIDGERDFAIPSGVVDDVLHPVLAGVLNGTGVTDPGETVVQTFRFSELTLVVTSDRLVKHVGGAVWDADFEEYHFEDVTRLDFEEGSVATQIVIEVDGRPQRIKTPNEHVAVVRERLTQALFAYYDVDSLAAFNDLAAADDPATDDASTDAGVDFGEGVDPLGADSGSSDRPADTSGDPFLEDDDDSRGGDAGGGREDRRRAQPAEDADAGGGGRRAQPAEDAGAGRGADATGTGASGGAGAGGDADPGDDPLAGGAVGADATGSTGGADASATAGGGDATADAAGGDAGAGDDGGGDEFAAAGFEPATASGGDVEALAARIDDLEGRVEAQNQLLERQQALLQQLIEELRER